jgi:diaminohydroxyphosphoribosylaminopyrimidine deaminase/5-amino-6-(5-phosphoribosylamino)uracil reductase
LDGKIASHLGDSRWISNERSRRFVHRLRHALDAIVVGVGTVIADDPSLTSRLAGKKASNPLRIILDTHLRSPLKSQVVSQSKEVPTLIACGPEPSRGGDFIATAGAGTCFSVCTCGTSRQS